MRKKLGFLVVLLALVGGFSATAFATEAVNHLIVTEHQQPLVSVKTLFIVWQELDGEKIAVDCFVIGNGSHYAVGLPNGDYIVEYYITDNQTSKLLSTQRVSFETEQVVRLTFAPDFSGLAKLSLLRCPFAANTDLPY